MGVCLPKQFRLLPPKQRPLASPTYDPEKQLSSSYPPASFADFTAVCRNKARPADFSQETLRFPNPSVITAMMKVMAFTF